MAIKHNVYEGGKVQSLGFSQHGVEFTVGVIEAGQYDFGIAKRCEEIRVVFGALFAKGREFDQPAYGGGKKLVFEVNEPIVFEALGTTAYICKYGPTTSR